jgi:hypothetical protein
MLALAGVERRDGMVGGGGIDLEGVSENVNGLCGLSMPSLLLFFEGEQSVAGSTFSLSMSSNSEGSKGRFTGENAGFEMDTVDLTLDADLCTSKPVAVSIEAYQLDDCSSSRTILSVLCTRKML